MMTFTLDAGTAGLILVGVLCVFAAGALAGVRSRHARHDDDAGDTHIGMAPLPPMRTADRQRIERQATAALARAEIVRSQPLRAGTGKRLKPSYDHRRDDKP